ncbi:very short patch repair endonuclease [Rhodopseudomonas sp. RCAM05734]|uniref:very short patch repair endonuclease n=1 Tax=Rhodopseudomonas sp. RCAM05734 TaxID=3457549 RepID=UPI00404407F0
MDTLTVKQRSERMARIKGKDTKPELAVRKALFGRGYRFRLHRKDLPGKPDLVFAGRRKVVFVHGCFWHAHENCKVANLPKSRTEFWQAKFFRNRERDKANEAALRSAGWDVLTLWECEARDQENMLDRLASYLGPSSRKTNGSAA